MSEIEGEDYFITTVNPQRKKVPTLKRKDDPKPVTFTVNQQNIMDLMIHQRLTTTQIAKVLNKDKSYVSRTIHLQKVQDELLKQVVRQRGSAAVLGLNTVVKLAETGTSEYVRLEAAKDLLDRSGFKAPDIQRVEGEMTIHIDLS